MGLLGCLVPGRKKRRRSARHVDIASLKFSTLSLKNTGSSTVRVYLNGQGPVLTSNGKYSCVELPPYQLTGPLEWEAHVEIGGGATCFASGSLPVHQIIRSSGKPKSLVWGLKYSQRCPL